MGTFNHSRHVWQSQTQNANISPSPPQQWTIHLDHMTSVHKPRDPVTPTDPPAYSDRHNRYTTIDHAGHLSHVVDIVWTDGNLMPGTGVAVVRLAGHLTVDGCRSTNNLFNNNSFRRQWQRGLKKRRWRGEGGGKWGTERLDCPKDYHNMSCSSDQIRGIMPIFLWVFFLYRQTLNIPPHSEGRYWCLCKNFINVLWSMTMTLLYNLIAIVLIFYVSYTHIPTHTHTHTHI